jgi:hypothetical protein
VIPGEKRPKRRAAPADAIRPWQVRKMETHELATTCMTRKEAQEDKRVKAATHYVVHECDWRGTGEALLRKKR